MSADGPEKTRPTRDRVGDGAEGIGGGSALGRFIYALEMLEHEAACHKCSAPSDEGMEYLVETAVNLLLPEATRMLRGDGWVLTREGDGER